MGEELTLAGVVEAIVYFAVAFGSVFLMIVVVGLLDRLVCWLQRKCIDNRA